MADRTLEGQHSRVVSPLVRVRPEGDRHPFFCIAAGYGDVLALARLGRGLRDDQPVYLLQPLPVARPDDPPSARLAWLVEEYARAVRSVRPNGPYLLGGNSSGGLIALEVARALGHQGAMVPLVVLFDTPYQITAFGYALLKIVRTVLPSRLPTSGIFRWLPLRRLLLVLLDEGFDAQVPALAGYRPTTYAGAVTHFVAKGSVLGRFGFFRQRWRQVVTGDLDVQLVPGDHLSFLRQPRYSSGLADGRAGRDDPPPAALVIPATCRQRRHPGGVLPAAGRAAGA